MGGIAVARQAIEGCLQAEWALSPIAWENTVSGGIPRIEVFVREAGSQRAALTGDRATGHRLYGTLQVVVVTAAGSGPGAGDAMVDALSGIFRERRLTASGGEVIFGDSETFSTVVDSGERRATWAGYFEFEMA